MGNRNPLQEITTPQYRCASAFCPGVLKLEDGRYAVRGIEVWPSGLVGPDERTVIFDFDMIKAAIEADKQKAQANESSRS